MLLYNNKDYTGKNVLKQVAMTVLILQFTGTVKSNIIMHKNKRRAWKFLSLTFAYFIYWKKFLYWSKNIFFLVFIGFKYYTLIILLQIQGWIHVNAWIFKQNG